ncbi:hypothetical protein QJS66_10950 [Kocuria rhizophila]|nr:hypothetical protein QJS66_10950 [Kocuria rhizophila]
MAEHLDWAEQGEKPRALHVGADGHRPRGRSPARWPAPPVRGVRAACSTPCGSGTGGSPTRPPRGLARVPLSEEDRAAKRDARPTTSRRCAPLGPAR